MMIQSFILLSTMTSTSLCMEKFDFWVLGREVYTKLRNFHKATDFSYKSTTILGTFDASHITWE